MAILAEMTIEDPAFQPVEAHLQRAIALLASHHKGDLPHPDATVMDLPADLPESGWGDVETMEHVAASFFGSAARLGHPGYFAHMDPPTPWMTWVGAMWAASLNQNLLHPDTGDGARELERQVISWLCPFFGMDGGHLVPGSSVANLTALWAARELKGVTTVAASEMAHLSIRKAASILGLEHREIRTDDQHRIRSDGLEGVDLNRTAVVLTAGTVAVGAIDLLDAFPDAAWRHVDAAWAGPLRLTRHAPLLDGIDRADSVSVSAHKWLFQPKESALILFRDSESAHEAVSFGGGYLAAPNVGILGSHGASALPLAATILAWGREGIATRIERCMRLADDLADRIESEQVLELLTRPVSGVVVWRPRDADTRSVREWMRDAFVSLTDIGGETWFRSVAANPQADPQLVVDSVMGALRGAGWVIRHIRSGQPRDN